MHVACVTGKDRADPGPTSRPGAAHLRGAQGSDGFAASGGRAQCVSCATRKVGARGRGADLCVRLGEVVVYDDAGNGPRVEDVSVVARHIQNVFAEGELDRATSLQNAARGQAGQLDIVDSVAIIRP